MTDTTNESNFISRSDFMKKAGLSIGGILLLNCLQACSDEAEVTPVSPTNPSAGSSRLDFSLDLNQIQIRHYVQPTDSWLSIINASLWSD